MPVTRLRGRDDRVDSVLVRRTGPDGEDVVEEVHTREPTATVDQMRDRPNARRQIDPSKLDFDLKVDERDDDGDDDYDDYDPDTSPSPIFVTTTLPLAQATAGALASNEDPSPTVVVEITPRPPPPPPHPKGGISRTTEHLLIAAGSIGATIILVMIILAIHTMRKRGLTFREVVKQGKYQVTRRGPPPPPPKAARWDSKPTNSVDYGSMRSNTVTPPQRAMSIARSGSTSSQRPLMALQRNESFNSRPMATERSGPSDPGSQSFLLDSPPGRSSSHRRDNSQTPSSPVLPLQDQRRSVSTHNTRSMSEQSELKYPEPAPERALSPLPPPPTFKQFLFNRPSVSGRPGPGAMVSRFSWTNSNAPQTPHDPNRDTTSYVVGRDSFMTQRSSVPRFRTVDSWVNQQANRIEAQKLKEQFRLTQASSQYTGDDERDVIPEVPQIPRDHVGGLAPTSSAIEAHKTPTTPPPPLSGGLPGKNVRHERHDTRTTVDTAPIFRHHPGTEVRFSTRSAVPSEILDMGRKNNVLS